MKSHNRFRLERVLIFLCLLGLAGTTLAILVMTTSDQHRLQQAITEFTTAQAELVYAHIGTIDRQARLAIDERDRLIDAQAQLIDAQDQFIDRVLTQMPTQQKPQWERDFEQPADLIIEPIHLPTFAFDLWIDWRGCFLVAVVSITLNVIGLFALLRVRPSDKVHVKRIPLPEEIEPSVSRGYQEIFSQPVDPIGNLHIWRLQAENDQDNLVDKAREARELDEFSRMHYGIEIIEDYEKKVSILTNGIRYVRELEEFLKMHCNIEMIEEYGNEVSYDLSQHRVETAVVQEDTPMQATSEAEKESYAPSQHEPQRDAIQPGAPVQVTAPGWKWQDTILRYPRVR